MAAIVVASFAWSSGRAQTPEQPQPEHRGLSLQLSAGPYSGFGGGLGFGTRDVGVRGLVGWAPVIVVVERPTSSDLELYSSLLVGPDLYFRLFRPRPATDIGGLAGYRYDSLLGHGVSFGGYARVELSRALDVDISVGLLIFPDGENRLKQERNLPSSTQFSFPGPKVNFGASIGLAFFP